MANSEAVRLLNPLPAALGHYERALTACLRDAGILVESWPCVDISVSDTGASRIATAGRAVRERLRYESGGKRAIVLWPAFGFLDPLMWAHAEELSLVFHDPSPLRRQFGLSQVSGRIGSRFQNPLSPRLIVHSATADAEMERRGLSVDAVLPLPMLRPVESWAPSDQVTVLGQFKAARDLALLSELGPLLKTDGLRPVIVGRGWPDVPGWEVSSRFLPESEFDEQLRVSAVVLLPYTKVFQSDVAVRAAELGVPVVAPLASNVSELFGRDWPGLVASNSSAGDWLSAVHRTSKMTPSEVSRRALTSHSRITRGWVQWLEDADGGPVVQAGDDPSQPNPAGG